MMSSIRAAAPAPTHRAGVRKYKRSPCKTSKPTSMHFISRSMRALCVVLALLFASSLGKDLFTSSTGIVALFRTKEAARPLVQVFFDCHYFTTFQ